MTTAARTISSALPSSNLLQWFRPDEEIHVVHSGECGAAIRELSRELQRVECFLRAGIDPPSRVLMSGPTGTGKTLSARWLARKLGVPIAIADVGSMSGKYAGEGQERLASVFTSFASVPDGILFLDEIEAICSSREHSSSSLDRENARVTTTLFQKLDWLPPARVVFAATNFADKLDPALRRRFTRHIVFTPPDRDARLEMLRKWLAKAPVPDELLEVLAEQTEGIGGAELRSRAMELGRRAVMASPEPPPRLRAVEPPPASKQAALGLADPPKVIATGANYRASVKLREPERAPDGVERLQSVLSMLDDLDTKQKAKGQAK